MRQELRGKGKTGVCQKVWSVVSRKAQAQGLITGLFFLGAVASNTAFAQSNMQNFLEFNPSEYFDQKTVLGRTLHDLSQNYQREEGYNYLIVTSALGENQLKAAMTDKGWSIIKTHILNTKYPDFYHADGRMRARALMISKAVTKNTVACDIRLRDHERVGDFLRDVRNQGGPELRRVFLHELGHCIHKRFALPITPNTTDQAIRDDIQSLARVGGMKDGLLRWGNQYNDASIRSMYYRHLREVFADVYAFAQMVHRDGHDIRALIKDETLRGKSLFNGREGAVYFTLPFILRAAQRRHEIDSFNSLGSFVQSVIEEMAAYTSFRHFNELLVAHLYNIRKLPAGHVRDRDRVNATLAHIGRFIRLTNAQPIP